jgi:hypothetical protein
MESAADEKNRSVNMLKETWIDIFLWALPLNPQKPQVTGVSTRQKNWVLDVKIESGGSILQDSKVQTRKQERAPEGG